MSEPMTDTPRIKVLIAEDLRSSRLNIQSLLRHWGYEPVACEDGLAARHALAAPDGPRVAILDWVMPGMTGPEVCKWIAEELGSFVYTILLTSKSDQGALIEGLTAGAHTYLTKPARPAELQTWIRVGLRMVDYEKELARKSFDLGQYARQMEALAEKRALQLAETGQCDALAGLVAGLGTEIRLNAQQLLDNLEELSGAAASQAGSAISVSNSGIQTLLEDSGRGLRRLLGLAHFLEHFNRGRKPSATPRCQPNDILQTATALCEASLASATNLELLLEPELPEVRAVQEVLQRAAVQFLLAACANAPGAIQILTRRSADGVALRMEVSCPGGPGVLKSSGLTGDLEMLEQWGGQWRLEGIPEGRTALIINLPAAEDG